MPGRRTPNRRFFRPPSPPFQPRDFRLPPRELLARELAPDTVVIARPTGGHFGSQICESAQERHQVGVLAFCHGLFTLGFFGGTGGASQLLPFGLPNV